MNTMGQDSHWYRLGHQAPEKTHAMKPTVGKFLEQFNNQPELANRKGHFLAIDGGIERETLQTTAWALQFAAIQRKKGISDLDKVTPKAPKIKKVLMKTALASNNLSLYIPETFADPRKLSPIRKFWEENHSMKHGFSMVIGKDETKESRETLKETTKILGDRRAFKDMPLEHGLQANLREAYPNGCPSESKAYPPKFFDTGYDASLKAQQTYESALGPEAVVLNVRNDLKAYSEPSNGAEDAPEPFIARQSFHEKWLAERNANDDKTSNTEFKQWYEKQPKAEKAKVDVQVLVSPALEKTATVLNRGKSRSFLPSQSPAASPLLSRSKRGSGFLNRSAPVETETPHAPRDQSTERTIKRGSSMLLQFKASQQSGEPPKLASEPTPEAKEPNEKPANIPKNPKNT